MSAQNGGLRAYLASAIFDGSAMHRDAALLIQGSQSLGVVPRVDLPGDAAAQDLGGGIIAPGFVDLQVNGGGGVMLNSDQSVDALATMARAHARIGATSILPTLITDTPDHTAAAIEATIAAIAAGVPGVEGLHLEGPHLSQSRKGAHDPALIRPMQPADLDRLIAAAARLPVLKLTVAPENVTTDQMRALAAAGVLISLGHSDAPYADCVAAAGAGARCVTHLFNAMGQLGNREPGLVGAALDLGDLSVGLIADMIHVHPASIATALRAKKGPGQIFLVSDSMATAGSDIAGFTLNGRWIARDGDRLSLEDGTLAGAHLELATAIRNMVNVVGIPLSQALAMATSVPAGVIGRQAQLGHLRAGAVANFVQLTDDLYLAGSWQNGARA